jgi:hypothetical protein
MIRASHLAAILLMASIASPTIAQDNTPARVIAVNLNLRAAPNGESMVIDTLPENAPLVVLQQDGPWFEVRATADGEPRVGWVHGNHIELVSMPAPQRAPSTPLPRLSRNTMSIDVVDFDCQEKMFDGGYRGCSVEIDVTIDAPSSDEEFENDSVSIECESTVSYKTADGFMSRTSYASDFQTIWVSYGYGSTRAYMTHSFTSIFDPVVSARLQDASCRTL